MTYYECIFWYWLIGYTLYQTLIFNNLCFFSADAQKYVQEATVAEHIVREKTQYYASSFYF